MIQRVRGTRDFLHDELRFRHSIEEKLRKTSELWGYKEIKTPTIEHLELFKSTSGETLADSIYEFFDRSGRKLCLRPELTAPSIRLYLQELKRKPLPLKLYYFDNCFRYDEPQRSRYREFWQYGVEIIGASLLWEAEAEVVALSYHIAEELGIQYELRIGNVGILRDTLKCDERMKSEILRLIDKKEIELAISKSGEEKLRDVLSAGSLEEIKKMCDAPEIQNFERMLEKLKSYDVKYKLDFSIARGLEYYTGMVFEIHSPLLAQSQICGGGSYLLRMDGESVISTGFAYGFDRLVEITPRKEEMSPLVVVVTTDDCRNEGIKISSILRKHFPTYLDLMGRSVKSQLSHANSIGASHAVIIGKKEVKENKVTLRDMRRKEQFFLSVEECISRIDDQRNNP